MQRLLLLLSLCLLLPLCCTAPAAAALEETDHPFILWNKDDVRDLRALIEKEPWAKQRYEQLKQERGRGQTHRNLLMYLVEGDRAYIEGELKDLKSFAGAKVDDRPWSDNHLVVLRYDVLYDLLSEAERKRIEDTFRAHIRYEIENDERTYGKPNWLPNMQHPRKLTAHLMAAALQEEKLIRDVWQSNGGLKYYFDDYVSDGQFYNEEFGKQYSTMGKILLWGRAMERLGLDDLGYGYEGKGGATIRKYLRSYLTLGYPRVDLGTGRYHYPHFTVGDAKGGRGLAGYPWQQSLLPGYLTDGSGGNALWQNSNMNGRDFKDRKVDQFLLPGWFELAHAKWPEDGWGYFLYQSRSPEAECYFPTLLFGHQRICEGDVPTPPSVESFVAPERGIAMLRANPGPGYWESPAPAVGLRLATPYMHEVPDVFALTGLYAFNRPIYVNHSSAGGYAGVDPSWSNSAKSHATVIVDGREPERIGQVETRHHFGERAKFVAATGEGIYDGVTQTRALVLTDDYLLDVFSLTSDRPRAYLWQVHPFGHAVPNQPGEWAATRHLLGVNPSLENERSSVIGDRDWSVTVKQRTLGADRELSGLGERFFEKKVGVRVHMLGESGTLGYLADTPVMSGDHDRVIAGAEEPAGVTLAAARNKASTTFAVVHEFFDASPTLQVIKLYEADDAVAVVVTKPGEWHDFVLLRWGKEATQPLTFDVEGVKVTFTGYAYQRSAIGEDAAHVEGNLKELEVANFMPISIERGPTSVRLAPKAEHGPYAAIWSQDRLALAERDNSTLWLTFEDFGMDLPVRARVKAMPVTLKTTRGLRVEPEVVDFNWADPGSYEVRVTAEPGFQGAGRISLALQDGTSPFDSAGLPVTVGVVAEREQVGPGDFTATVYAPRYLAKFYYMDSASAGLLLDPAGLRRSGPGEEAPRVMKMGEGKKGSQWQPVKLGGYAYFVPRNKGGGDAGEERFMDEPGQHAHGARSPLAWTFRERWMEVRYKDAKGERVAYEWPTDAPRPGVIGSIAAKKQPGASAWFDAEGERHEGEPSVEGDAEAPSISAVYRRGAGLRYGALELYPPGTTWSLGRPAAPADVAVGFTFAKDDEVQGLIGAWREHAGATPEAWQDPRLGAPATTPSQ